MTLVVSTAAEQDEQERGLAALDSASGRCRDLVGSLESTYRAELAAAVAARCDALDAAWEAYQRQVGAPGAKGAGRRSEQVAGARARYNDAAAAAGDDYEQSRGAALEAFVSGLDAVCTSYEGAVDEAIRTAVGLDSPAVN